MTSSNEDQDFESDADFELDDVVFPYAPPQQWVVLHQQLNADDVGVYTFLMAHMNPHTGKFDATPGRKRIAERFGKSLDWVDRRLKALVTVGALSKRWMYWKDAHDHSKGKSVNPTDSRGVKRAQAPNRYRVHLKPKAGAAYDGPIKIGEFYRPDRVSERVEQYTEPGDESAGDPPAATQRPPSEQGKQDKLSPEHAAGADMSTDQGRSEFSQVNPRPHHSGPGGAAPQRPRGPHHSGPKEHGGKDHGNPKTTGVATTADATLRFGVLANEPAGNSAYGVAKQGELCSNHLHARAKAGAAALAAIEANPDITEPELAQVIGRDNPRLTHGQAVGRSAALLAWERKPAQPAQPRSA